MSFTKLSTTVRQAHRVLAIQSCYQCAVAVQRALFCHTLRGTYGGVQNHLFADEQSTSPQSAAACRLSQSQNPLPHRWTCASSPVPHARCERLAMPANHATQDSPDALLPALLFRPIASRRRCHPNKFLVP